MHEQSNEQIAWAAGLFEGEGSITVYHGNISLKVASTDRDVIERFAEVVGVGNVYRREEMRQAHWKAVSYWQATGQRDCVPVMERFLPYLGERRTARWAEALAQRQAWRPERECPECHEMFQPVRRGQVTCGQAKGCSQRYFRRVGHFGGKARHTAETRARMSAAHKRQHAAKRTQQEKED